MKGVQAALIGVIVVVVAGSCILGGLLIGLATGDFSLMGFGIAMYILFVVWANWK